MKVDKVIITNFKALRNKYAAAGVSKIRDGISKLIVANKNRGLATRLIALDDAGAMREFSTHSVSNPRDPKQNKIAIDALYKALAPDFLMILGAADVVPHQDLKNPAFSPGPNGDPDKFAYGDLPYACEHAYSRQPQDFVGPTRVVGRLPDLKGGKDPHYILGLLETAANYSSSSPQRYRSYFSISAEIWKKSTTLSLTHVFGSASHLGTVPPEDDQWSSQLLGRLSHFINCHGAETDPKFYGQPASGAKKFPVAFTASYAKGKIKRGTIAAVECCYGGQLYDPSLYRGQMGICNTYLANKAYGFFASTTIAYGDSDSNSGADLICQYFLDNILTGGSLGQAVSKARQSFVHDNHDPVDLKTLAQFNLYGDPSVTPVMLPAAKKAVGPIPKAMVAAERVERSDRRRSLFRRGVELMTSVPVPHLVRTPPARSIRSELTREARRWDVRPTDFLRFVVRHPARTTKLMPKALVHKEVVPTVFHIVFGETATATLHRQKSVTRRKWAEMEGPRQIVLLVAKEVNGKIVSIYKTVSR